MRVEVGLDDSRFIVEISPAGVSVDGRKIDCDWIRIGETRYSLILDGRVFDLSADSADGRVAVACRQGSYVLSVSDFRTSRASPEPGETHHGPLQLRADMPGKVVRLLVRPGDLVAAGQALLVLEAMKMQNEIRSPKSGMVGEIAVEAGMTVNSGGLLIAIE
jgi:biotin carboxyl carrier protein